MLKRLEIAGFKSFAKKTLLDFSSATTAIVGPNGSGKSNVSEAFRFALGEQSMKSMRGKRTEDLIWNGSATMPRSNRASVTIVFDNRAHAFRIDFDEVAITRTVFRDGASEYAINGSRVRLRDVEELLAGANVGESGHHIISQGEADRILLANANERRVMLEDALGLRVYEFKKEEARKKLEKTQENIAQVQSLRRELAPHLKFLGSQVEKLDRAEELRKKFIALAQTYFAIEDAALVSERGRIAREKQSAELQLSEAAGMLQEIEGRDRAETSGEAKHVALRDAETRVETIEAERATGLRAVGRIEGALEATKKRSAQVAHEPYTKIPRADLVTLAEAVTKQAEESHTAESIAAALRSVATLVKRFVDRFVAPRDDLLSEEEDAVYALEHERARLLEADAAVGVRLDEARHALLKARESLASYEEAGKEERRRLLGYAERKADAEAARTVLAASEAALAARAQQLERDKTEAAALVGLSALSYEPLSEAPEEPAETHGERHRSLERLKIRLEEAGSADEAIRTEHAETVAREQFLSREIQDLEHSASGLSALIGDLDAELEKHFADGLRKVNASFNEYVALLFGGGSARLALEEPEESDSSEESSFDEPKAVLRAGLEIAVSLPRKKVRSLLQLSGGERSLISIALIFSMSQVNPPPFLILDETDAALDEANSRRYGDMIEALAKRSQLIVITHNRETMSRAGILYGVTMGSDGQSKLLSVQLAEAVSVAK